VQYSHAIARWYICTHLIRAAPERGKFYCYVRRDYVCRFDDASQQVSLAR
jgi:hypothetical protein